MLAIKKLNLKSSEYLLQHAEELRDVVSNLWNKEGKEDPDVLDWLQEELEAIKNIRSRADYDEFVYRNLVQINQRLDDYIRIEKIGEGL